jgi:hypothetical protein
MTIFTPPAKGIDHLCIILTGRTETPPALCANGRMVPVPGLANSPARLPIYQSCQLQNYGL